MRKSKMMMAGALALALLAAPLAAKPEVTAYAANGYADVQVLQDGYDESLRVFTNTLFAKKDNMYGMLRFDGTEVIPFVYTDYSISEEDGMILLEKTSDKYKKTYDLYDAEGNLKYSTDWYLDKKYPDYVRTKESYVNLSSVSYNGGLFVASYYDYVAEAGKKGTSNSYKVAFTMDGTSIDETLGVQGEYGRPDVSRISATGYVIVSDYIQIGAREGDKTLYGNRRVVSKDGIVALDDPQITADMRVLFARGQYILFYRDNEETNAYTLYRYAVESKSMVVVADDMSYRFRAGITGDGVLVDNGDDGTYYYWSPSGRRTEEKYSSIEACTEAKNYYLVAIGEHYFYIDSEGNEVGFDAYKDACKFNDGKAMVVNANNEAYQIDENFNRLSDIVSAETVTPSYVNNNRYQLKRGDMYYAAIISDNRLTVAEDNNWYYTVNGNVAADVTGLVFDTNVGWWYVKNGQIDFTYNGVIEYNGAWWCVAGGKVIFDYTGLWFDPVVGWWYIANGTIDFDYNGLVENEYGWWKVTNGTVDFGYNGLAENEYGWWKITNGTVDFGYNGIAENEYGWWKVTNGTVDFGYNGIAENEYGWWKITNGMVDFGYNGLAENEYGWWKITNGMVDFGYNGLAENEYGWWKITNGTVDFGYNGLAENEYGWWKITNGTVDFGYNGLAENEYGWWKVANGAVDFDYTGYADNQYGTWYVRNGLVDVNYQA